jgi:hypothetical protein
MAGIHNELEPEVKIDILDRKLDCSLRPSRVARAAAWNRRKSEKAPAKGVEKMKGERRSKRKAKGLGTQRA